MRASEVVLQELLAGKVQYRVPLFQRAYTWANRNWVRLWDDVLELYALPTPSPNETPYRHFIGAIVTLPIPDAPERVPKYMLIDGQQRLTTLLILLSVIRDAARGSTATETLADQITDECLDNRYARQPEERDKLRPTQVDVPAFHAIITGSTAVPDGRIAQAFQYFRTELARGDLDGASLDLGRLKDRVTDWISLVSIRLESHDSPHRIFESLNNAGMPLSASDLVRNHVFMRIQGEAQQNTAYEQHWLPMQRRLESEEAPSALTDFFWRFLMMDGDLPRYDDVFESMRGQIERETVPPRNRTVADMLAELNRFSQHYVRFWRPERDESSPPLRARFIRLNTWEVGVAFPFLLHVMERLRTGALTEVQVLTVLQMIESYVVRRFVCGIPTNRLRRVFAQMNRQLEGGDFVPACRAYLQRNEWPTDEAFRQRFQTIPLYIDSRTSRVRLILNSLEESFEHKEPVTLHEGITIEHVMPQTLNDAWREMLGPNYESDYDTYLHTIGNLTFSGYNQQMGNSPFEEKKTILLQSHFELNRGITQQASWTANEIRSRAAVLANCAVAIWPREE